MGKLLKGLSKIAGIIKRVATEDDMVVPWIKRFFPKYAAQIDKAEDSLDQIAGLVVKGEIVGQAIGSTGPEKAAEVGRAVEELLLDKLVAGRKIANPALFRQGAARISGGVADVINSLEFEEPEA